MEYGVNNVELGENYTEQ